MFTLALYKMLVISISRIMVVANILCEVCICNDSITDVKRVVSVLWLYKMNWARLIMYQGVCLIELVSNAKA